MNENLQKIAEAAHADNGWKVEDVRVDEVERLRRGSCSFYTVGHKVRPIPFHGNYALVGGKVMRSGDGNAVAKILDACGKGAPADWWAEIVTRFHRDLGVGVVLRDENVRSDITRQLAAAGQRFTAPAMDPGKTSITFLLLDPETYVLYRVHAARTPGGPVTVEKSVVPLPAAVAGPRP
jgi:hypothetical protein